MLVPVTAMTAWEFIISATPVNKNKITRTILYNHKDLIAFQHEAPNSHVPVFHFVEFLVNALPTTNHREFA